MMRKTLSHGRIGEAAVTAKCWMHGIPAYNTGGLRANFAGSDLIVDTTRAEVKKLIQVKSGYVPGASVVYMTQCKGDEDLTNAKFVSDFVVFVNIDRKAGTGHQHDGTLGFEHLTFYVVPRADANRLYLDAVKREHSRPLRNGGQRKLGNMAVHVAMEEMVRFKDAWHLIQKSGNVANDLPNMAGSASED